MLPYALWSLGAFFSQHLVILAAAGAWHQPLKRDWWFYLAPLRSIADAGTAPGAMLILALAYLLIVAWILAVLAFRRAADADISGWIAACAIAPVVQIVVILLLCIVPSRTPAERGPAVAEVGTPDEPWWPAAAMGVIAGLGLTLAAVATGALLFGTYGFGMFVISPFIIGAATAYAANRKTDIGGSGTALLVTGAAALGGIALVVVALEGLLCIVMAAPLGIGVALVGGLLGRAIALSTRRAPRQTLPGLALLPLVFAIERAFPPTMSFDTYQTIEVGASAEAVWASIVRMETIQVPPPPPFRLGIAYPLGGEIIGGGVGAVRRGEFSTGTALERVTEWIPNRKLAFTVVEDVPAMRELSPYRQVHAPHVLGYFRTTSTSFELSERPNGRTEIIERTSHELRLDPVLYWLPMVRWVVHENNARVLVHVRQQAERTSLAAAAN
jgi:uncharacterized membrane protein YhaH (DUF805 family)